MYRLEKVYEWSELMLKTRDYMRMAFKHANKYSSDISTQVGAVLVSKNGEILSFGTNGIPYPIKETEERLQRPLKYFYTEHAERDAVFGAATATQHNIRESVYGSTLYCTWAACAECAKTLIRFGVKKVVTSQINLMESVTGSEWKDSLEAAKQMFVDAGVEFEVYVPPENEEPEIVDIMIRGLIVEVEI